ncbi:MAG: response regulator [Paracoccaceae bacterium]|nr:response regulator [Paracoccaceae bacterium]
MPDTLEDLIMLQPPTADRPLLGSVILVVEDSRHACEAMRLICQRSGARIRRAESLASAERHLRTYRPRIAVVDLGLPDGSGLHLIEKLSRSDARIDGIIATSGNETLHESALQAGADIFMPKPIASISAFQQAALSLLPKDIQPETVARPGNDNVVPDLVALKDDLTLAAELMKSEPDPETLDYLTNFLMGLAKSTGNPFIAEVVADISAYRNGVAGDFCPLRLAEAIERHAAQMATV